MAKTQLYIRHKDMLMSFARKAVRADDEKNVMDDLYAKIAPQVKAIVETKYPPKDMKVLLKYEQAYRDSCINLSGHDGQVRRFNFRDVDDEGDDDNTFLPYVPGTSRNYGCNSRVYLAGKDLSEMIDDFNQAKLRYEAEIAGKTAKYKAVIQAVRYFEELLEIWPAAEAMREQIMADRQAVTILSADVIAQVKADNAGAEV